MDRRGNIVGVFRMYVVRDTRSKSIVRRVESTLVHIACSIGDVVCVVATLALLAIYIGLPIASGVLRGDWVPAACFWGSGAFLAFVVTLILVHCWAHNMPIWRDARWGRALD